MESHKNFVEPLLVNCEHDMESNEGPELIDIASDSESDNDASDVGEQDGGGEEEPDYGISGYDADKDVGADQDSCLDDHALENTDTLHSATLSLRTMNEMTSMTPTCVIRSWYAGRFDVCADCFLIDPSFFDFFGEYRACFEHKTGPYAELSDMWCSNCNRSMSVFIAHNMCTFCKYRW